MSGAEWIPDEIQQGIRARLQAIPRWSVLRIVAAYRTEPVQTGDGPRYVEMEDVRRVAVAAGIDLDQHGYPEETRNHQPGC